MSTVRPIPSAVMARESGQSSNHRRFDQALNVNRADTAYWMPRFRGA
jgi:hypothetical protein